jgi:hypothetical protein
VVGLLAAQGVARAQSPAAAPPAIAVGDWQLTPLLELRTRGEFQRDAPELAAARVAGSDPSRNAFGVLERSRLGLGAEYGATRDDPGVLRAQITLQDARAWGVPAPTGILGASASGPSSFGLYEAWGEARTTSARPAFVRVGRQAITWGDGRLLSNADWSPVARTLDAIRAHASPGLFDVELFAAILEPSAPLGATFGANSGAYAPSPLSTGTQLYGAQAGLALAPLLRAELSLLARVSRGSPTDASRSALARAEGETYAASLRVFGESRGWRYAVEGVYELGRAKLLDDASLSAWAAAGYVEKKIDGLALSPVLRLEADYASGDDGRSGTYRQFDPLLPDLRELHGAMDLFAWSNTAQASARLSVVPFTEGRAALEYRYARLAQSVGDWESGYLTAVAAGRPGAGTELGHEVDVWASWRPWPALDLLAGYSLFAAGDGAKGALAAVLGPDLTPAPVSHFGYVQATLRVP